MSSEGVSSLYIPEYMRILWYIHWAAYGAPLWNELYPSKKDKLADGSARRRWVSHSHFKGADFCGPFQVV